MDEPFYWQVFPFHLLQSASTEFLLLKTRRVLAGQANVRYHKNQGFFTVLLLIYNQKKIKILHSF